MTWTPALTPEQEAELVAEYLGEDDWSINELSVMFKVSQRTVYRVLSKHNAKRDKWDRAPTKSGRKVNGQFSVKRRRDPAPKPKKPLQPCGTNAAYVRHKAKGEYPCTPCLEAHALDTKNRKSA